jgi:hypothetical protein
MGAGDNYLLRNVNTAMPRAKMPARNGKNPPLRAGTNAASPYHKKNTIRHQAAIVLGILILHSPLNI